MTKITVTYVPQYARFGYYRVWDVSGVYIGLRLIDITNIAF